jgi:hypothetical protein
LVNFDSVSSRLYKRAPPFSIIIIILIIKHMPQVKKPTTPNKQKVVLKIKMDVGEPEVNAMLDQHANTVAEAFKLLGLSLTLHRHQWSRAQVSLNPMAYL